MQDILCRLESNRSRFRSYAPTAVPNPLQASALICPGFSFFYTFFSSSLSLHRHLSESFSLGINPGWERRAERLQCSCRPVHPELVLFVSDCCFCCLIDKCKFVFKHIFSSFLQPCFFVTYTVCGNFKAWIFFCGFFCVLNLPEFRLEFGWLYNCIYYQTALPQENEIARLNVANEYWFSPAGNFAGCKFTGFVNYSKNKHLANSCR